MSEFFGSAISGATLFDRYPGRSAALRGKGDSGESAGESFEKVAIAALRSSQLSLDVLVKQQPWFPVSKMKFRLEEALIVDAKARRERKKAPRRITYEEALADMGKQSRAFRSLRSTCVQPLFPYYRQPFLDLSQASDKFYTKLRAFDE